MASLQVRMTSRFRALPTVGLFTMAMVNVALAQTAFTQTHEVDGVSVDFPGRVTHENRSPKGSRMAIYESTTEYPKTWRTLDSYGLLVTPPYEALGRHPAKGFLGATLNVRKPGSDDVESVADTQAVVVSVDKGSPAEGAAIDRGDVIVEINGERVSSAADAIRKISAKPPGAEVLLVIEHEGKTRQVTVRLSERLLGLLRFRVDEWRAQSKESSPNLVRNALEIIEATPVLCQGFLGFQWYGEEVTSDAKLKGYVGVVVRELAVDGRIVRMVVTRSRTSPVEEFSVEQERLKTRHASLRFFQTLRVSAEIPAPQRLYADDGVWLAPAESHKLLSPITPVFRTKARGDLVDFKGRIALHEQADNDDGAFAARLHNAVGRASGALFADNDHGSFVARLHRGSSETPDPAAVTLSLYRPGTAVCLKSEDANWVRMVCREGRERLQADPTVTKWRQEIAEDKKYLDLTAIQVEEWEARLKGRGGFGNAAGAFTARGHLENWRRTLELDRHREQAASLIQLWNTRSTDEQSRLARLQPDLLWELAVSHELLRE